MTAFDIKILAVVFMLIDHIGRVFLDSPIAMVSLGRLSFPLFAWLAAQGEIYTSNLRNYLLRLIAIGLVTQPFYAEIWRSIFPGSSPPWNILFTLAYGVFALRLVRRWGNPWVKVSLFILLAGIAELLRIEGGMSAILTMGVIAQFRLGHSCKPDQEFEPRQKIANVLWYGLLIALAFLDVALFQSSTIELAGLLAPLLLLGYNGKQGTKAKWFYLIYPLHFVGILAVRQYVLPYVLPWLDNLNH